MLKEDLRALAPGDSVCGLWDSWADEYPVVAVAPMRRGADGRHFRSVSVAHGRTHVTASIVANGPEIRCTRALP